MALSDRDFMKKAIALAKQGEFTARPNPIVGCVIVRENEIVGSGYHRQAGTPHAECHAIVEAGTKAMGATCYVTLEPCVHQGRTGPCVQALLAAGIKKVIAASLDPNPQVSGKGLQALREAGVEVAYGLLQEEARALNLGFFSRMLRQKPYVRAKIAMSLDGRIAMGSGESQWITDTAAREEAHLWRARCGAIVTGSQTVIRDNCRLTVRHEKITFLPPLRVIIDSQLRVPANAAIFQQPGKTIIAVSERISLSQQNAWISQLPENSSEVACIALPEKEGHVDVAILLQWLGEQEINEVMLEAGAKLTGALLQKGLVDECLIFIAPKFLGSDALGMAHLPGITKLKDHIRGNFVGVTSLGTDLLLMVRLNDFASEQYGNT